MKSIFKNYVFLVLVITGLLLERPAEATCGGEFCPIRVQKSEEIQYAQTNFYEGWGVGTHYRTAAFDIGGKGYYNALFVQPMYFNSRFSAGALLPIIQLYQPGVKDGQYGIGNPLLMAEYYPLNGATMLAIGSMVELPFGNDDKGMAANHTMLIPYVTLTQAIAKGYVGGQLGYQAALNGHDHNHDGHDHEHEHGVLYFNPHQEQELLYRAFLGWRFGSYTPELLFSGRYAVEVTEGADRSFLNIGTIQRYRLQPNVELSLTFELPILSLEREWFRAGGGVYYQIVN